MTGKNGNINQTSSNFTALLVDSSLSLETIKKHLNKKILVISFDYSSHKKLLENNIDHIVSDSFLDDNDLDHIQKHAYKMYRWYEKLHLLEYIEYDGINFGRLVFGETLYYLVQILKKFTESRYIVNKYQNFTFLASSSLFDIVKIFTESVKKIEHKKEAITSFHQKIRFNFKIGNKQFMIFIPRSVYQNFKKFSEKIIHLQLGPSQNRLDKKKTTLVVEFDTIKFKDFFQASKKSSLHLMIYCRRRPAIWNFESYSIIKNSSSNVITYNDLSDKKVKNSLQNGIDEVSQKIKKLFPIHEDFFNQFFSIDGISIWSILKPYLTELLEQRITEIVLESELAKRLFEKYDINNILVLSEVGFTEQIVVKQAKKSGIPVSLLQAGLYWDTSEANEMNRSQGVYPFDADKFIVFGDVEKEDAILNGEIPLEKIQVLGSPRYDKFSLKGESNSDNYILLATTGPQPEIIHGLRVNNIEKYEESIIRICKIITKLKQKLVIKLHPSQDELDITNLARKINPNIHVVTMGEISALIPSCSVMISLGVSTSILEAQLFQKPVISIPIIDYKWGNPTVYTSKSCIVSTLNDLEAHLMKLLNNSKYKNEVIQLGNNFINNYFTNRGTASSKVLDFLTTF